MLVLKSGTEPLLRVMVEAHSKEVCELCAQSILDAIRSNQLLAEG